MLNIKPLLLAGVTLLALLPAARAEDFPLTPGQAVMMLIPIPDAVVTKVAQDKLIAKAYLNLLSRLVPTPAVSAEGRSQVISDPDGEPVLRWERYGDAQAGLELRAEPIISGLGVHGERGEWQFMGLPEGVSLKGRHRLDLRGGGANFLALEFICETPACRQAVDLFGAEITALTPADPGH